MTTLLLTWTDVWLAIGKAFQWMFQFLPAIGFVMNLFVWLCVAFLFFYWLYRQAKDTKRAKAEGRLI